MASLKQTSGHKSNIITDTSIIYFQNCIPHCKKYAGTLSKITIISAELLDPFSQTISIRKTHQPLHLRLPNSMPLLNPPIQKPTPNPPHSHLPRPKPNSPLPPLPTQ